MNRIERYLGSVVLMHSLLVMMVLMVIFAFFEFMNQLGDVNESYTLGHGALYTLLKIPVYGYEVFPIVLLIGTLMGLGGLANHSELTVLRVTGWSIKRILLAVLKTALLMWLFMLAIGEFVAPESEAYAKKVKAEALNQSLSIGSSSGLWLKDEQQYIHVDRVISSEKLQGIKIYQLRGNELVTVTSAKTANFVDGWVFQDVNQLNVNKTEIDNLPSLIEITSTAQSSLKREFALQPEDLVNLDIESRYLSAWALYKQIEFLQQNDLDASPYLLSFWRKLGMPLVVIAMIAVVFPLVFGSMRQVNVGQRIFLGVLIGMGFHLINQLIGNIAVVYHFPIWLAALAPASFVVMGAWHWLQKAE